MSTHPCAHCGTYIFFSEAEGRGDMNGGLESVCHWPEMVGERFGCFWDGEKQVDRRITFGEPPAKIISKLPRHLDAHMLLLACGIEVRGAFSGVAACSWDRVSRVELEWEVWKGPTAPQVLFLVRARQLVTCEGCRVLLDQWEEEVFRADLPPFVVPQWEQQPDVLFQYAQFRYSHPPGPPP